MRADDAGDGAFVGDRERGVAELRSPFDQFLRVRSAAQEAEVRQAMQFRVSHLRRAARSIANRARSCVGRSAEHAMQEPAPGAADARETPTTARPPDCGRRSNRAGRRGRPTSRSRCAPVPPRARARPRSAAARRRRATAAPRAATAAGKRSQIIFFPSGKNESVAFSFAGNPSPFPHADSGRCSGTRQRPWTASVPNRARRRSTNCGTPAPARPRPVVSRSSDSSASGIGTPARKRMARTGSTSCSCARRSLMRPAR